MHNLLRSESSFLFGVSRLGRGCHLAYHLEILPGWERIILCHFLLQSIPEE